jgi:hypothetical protein
MRSAILFRATEHLTKRARDASNAGRCEMDRHNSVPCCNPHGGPWILLPGPLFAEGRGSGSRPESKPARLYARGKKGRVVAEAWGGSPAAVQSGAIGFAEAFRDLSGVAVSQRW